MHFHIKSTAACANSDNTERQAVHILCSMKTLSGFYAPRANLIYCSGNLILIRPVQILDSPYLTTQHSGLHAVLHSSAQRTVSMRNGQWPQLQI